jgi:hypothetical protein
MFLRAPRQAFTALGLLEPQIGFAVYRKHLPWV